MTDAAELARQLSSLRLLAADDAAERTAKLAGRRELAERLCLALDSGPLDLAAAVAAARALLGVSSAGPRFAARAEQLARLAWERGHEQAGPLYARATDLLCILRGGPQRYGTLVYQRFGEKLLQPVDETTTDEERVALGVPPLRSVQTEIADHNRRKAAHLARTSGLPPGAELRRVWRDEDPGELLRRRDAAGSPAWREGEELVVVWESDAENVRLGGGLELPLWRVDGTDVWVLRARIGGLDQAIVSLGFLGTFEGTTRYIGGDGCWRGDFAPPAPPVRRPLSGDLVEASLPGPTATERRKVTVYRPPGRRFGVEHPVVYIADGHMTEALASVLEPAIVEGRVPPTVLVGVASSGLDGKIERANEYLAGRAPERFEAHRAFFVEAVGRWAEEEHGATTNRRHRMIFGVSAGATFAATMGIRHPDRFGTVLAFSMGWPPADFPLWSRGDVPRHYLAAGTLEEGFRTATAGLAVAVTRAGGECVHVEAVSGHDYRMWEGQFVEAVAWALT